jgi:hypothetical protein
MWHWGGNLNPHSVSVRPWPHSGIHIWTPFWTQRTLGYYVWGPSGTLLKEQGSYNLVQNMGHKGPVLRPRCIGPRKAWIQMLFYSILFYHVCPAICTEQLGSHRTDYYETWYLSIFLNLSRKSNKKNGNFTWRPMHIYDNILLYS